MRPTRYNYSLVKEGAFFWSLLLREKVRMRGNGTLFARKPANRPAVPLTLTLSRRGRGNQRGVAAYHGTPNLTAVNRECRPKSAIFRPFLQILATPGPAITSAVVDTLDLPPPPVKMLVVNLHAARILAVSLMNQHRLVGCCGRSRSTTPRRRFGCCNFTRRRISLSRPLTFLNDEAEVRDTILHEIAHALTPKTGHGPAWKAMCLRIGAKPVRCFQTDEVVTPPRRPGTDADRLHHLRLVGRPSQTLDAEAHSARSAGRWWCIERRRRLNQSREGHGANQTAFFFLRGAIQHHR